MKHAIVVAADWPETNSGYGLALRSSLAAYEAYFECVHLCSPGERPAPAGPPAPERRVQYPLDASSPARRFAASILSGEPAILRRLRPGREQLLSAIGAELREPAETAIIYEDLSAAGILFEAAARWPAVTQIVRCHNVLAEAFSGLGSGPGALAWAWEIRRIRRFEKAAVAAADRLWALSERDAAELTARYGRAPDGVLPLALETERYRTVGPGAPRTVVHVGSADLRKGHGLRWFLDEVWPRIRARSSGATVVLGGRGTERLARPHEGIVGLGYVPDDREVLGLGRVFVNPQRIGSGVKVKSLTALAAARALVSTSTGVEGIAVGPGLGCFVSDDAEGMAQHVIRLLGDPQLADRAGEAGRTFVEREYAPAIVRRRLSDLMRRAPSEERRNARG